MQKQSEILLADLLQHRMQTSEDDAALLRFAMQVAADDVELLPCLRSHRQVSPEVRRRALTLHRRRLHGLAQLAQDHHVEAFWVGTGFVGRHETGLNRVRCYRLRTHHATPFHGVRDDLFRYMFAGGSSSGGRDDNCQGRVECAEIIRNDSNGDFRAAGLEMTTLGTCVVCNQGAFVPADDLSTAMQEWLATLTTQPETVASHGDVLNLFRSWLQGRLLDLATLNAYVSYLQEERGLRASTIRWYINVLIRWIAWLCQSTYRNMVADDLCQNPDVIRQELIGLIRQPETVDDRRVPDLRRLPAHFEIERQRWLRQWSIDHVHTDVTRRREYLNILRNRALIAVLFASGARLSRVLDLHTNQLKESPLRLDDLARTWLAEYLDARQLWYADQGAVFISHGPRANGKIMSSDSSERAVKAAALWLADRRAAEEGTADEIERLRSVSSESIRRFLAQSKQDAATEHFPRPDLSDVQLQM